MKEHTTVLIADDEPKITEAVAAYLESKNFTVFTADTGAGALRLFAERQIGFVILDLMLPDMPGEEVCARIRSVSSVPVVMLTAKAQEEDIVKGLNLGADDYIVKPFSLRQLHARMLAVARRAEGNAPTAAKYSWNGGDLTVDFQAMEIYKAGRKISLTSGEWKIFSALVGRPQTVFTRERLIQAAFGDDFDGYDRAVDTHVKNLRKKIETDTRRPVYILTVRGSGYKFGGTN